MKSTISIKHNCHRLFHFNIVYRILAKNIILFCRRDKIPTVNVKIHFYPFKSIENHFVKGYIIILNRKIAAKNGYLWLTTDEKQP